MVAASSILMFLMNWKHVATAIINDDGSTVWLSETEQSTERNNDKNMKRYKWNNMHIFGRLQLTDSKRPVCLYFDLSGHCV